MVLAHHSVWGSMWLLRTIWPLTISVSTVMQRTAGVLRTRPPVQKRSAAMCIPGQYRSPGIPTQQIELTAAGSWQILRPGRAFVP